MAITLEAKIGKRGQVVIPKPIREAYDLKPGTTVAFGVEGGSIVLKSAGGALDDYLAAIPKRAEPSTIDWDEQYYTQLGE